MWFTRACGERVPHFTKESYKTEAKGQERIQESNDFAWSDSDSSDSEDEEQGENLHFMVKEDQVQEVETEYESSVEVDCCDFLEYFKDKLAQALNKCTRYEQEYLSKIKSLKKTICDLSFEKEVLQKLNNESHTRIETLEKEKKELQSKYEGLEKVAMKFSKAQDNLSLIHI